MPGKQHIHSDKWHRCWEKVQDKGADPSSAAAICTAALGDESYNEGAMIVRDVHLVAAAGKIRTAQYNGKEHVVMPVTALVEGVLHAVNSETPELVLAEEFAIAPTGWNGRPVVMNHPEIHGKKVSANTPKVLEDHQFGFVFNTKVVGKTLQMEAWLDPERAKAVGKDAVRTLERIKKADPNDPIEVSVGVFIIPDDESGNHNGTDYKAVWRHITPDHLAILSEGKVGACSVDMGCGTRYMTTARGYKKLGKTNKITERRSHMTFMERLKALVKTEERHAQYANGADDPADEAAELLQYQTMQMLLTQAGNIWDQCMSVVKALVAAETTEGTTADESAEETMETAQLNVVQEQCMAMQSLLGSVNYLARQLNVDDYPTVQSIYMEAKKKLAAAECHCQDEKEGKEADVTKAERVKALMEHPHNPVKDKKYLEGATDEALKSLEEHADKTGQLHKEAEDRRAADEKAAADKKAEDEKQQTGRKPARAEDGEEPETPLMTAEAWLASAPAEVRDMVARHQQKDAAAKAALVGKLKTAQSRVTEAQLKERSLDQLEEMAALLKVDAPPIDYTGRGVRTAEQGDDDYLSQPPPDGYAIALERRKKAS